MLQFRDMAESSSAELVIHGPEARRFGLGQESVLLGRGKDCDVVVDDPTVSRQHCRLLRDSSGAWSVEDLNSRSGTWVGDRRIRQRTSLEAGTWLRIGGTRIQLAALAESALILSGDPMRDARLLEQLLAASKDMAATDDLESLLRSIVDQGIQVAGGDRGALFLRRGAADLEIALARDSQGNDLAVQSLTVRSLPMKSLNTRRPVVLPSVSETPGDEVPVSVFEARCRSVVSLPLPGETAPRGVLYIDSRSPAEDFGIAHLAVLTMLASRASLALERAQQFQRLDQDRKRLERENHSLRRRLQSLDVIGECAEMQRTLELLRRIAPSEATVCLVGETGTGKEVLARYLHRASPRADQPFVVVDCGALPENLVESELFGHERGAFTGAVAGRQGRLREAHGGTVFLDEVAEIPLPLQSRLLRFVQEGNVRPIGGKPVKVDARIVCATHRDLLERVARGTFREDLYYRLAVLTVQIPPLKDRGDDILLLAHFFLDRARENLQQPVEGFSSEAKETLLRHPWPGNVRELEHRVQRGALLTTSPFITAQDLGLASARRAGGESPQTPEDTDQILLPLQLARSQATERFERSYLRRLLGRSEGSIPKAAELAGVSRQAIYSLLQKHSIDPGEPRR